MNSVHEAGVLVDRQIGPSGRVSIRLASADLRIGPSGSDRVTVRVPGGDSVPNRLAIETTDGGITIREKETFGLTFAIGRRAIRLDVAVPVAAEIASDIASGDVETHGLRGAQRHRSASGDLRLIDAAGDIEVITVSGDAHLELSAEARLAVRTVSGDVVVSGGSLSQAHVSTTSGDVRLDSPLVGRADHSIETLSGDAWVRSAAGIQVEAKTVSGDLTSDLPHRSDGRMGRRTLIVGDGAIRLAFRSVSGDLHVTGAVDGSGGRHDDPVPASSPDRSRPPAPPSSVASPGSSVSHDDSMGDVPAARGAGSNEPPESSAAERMAILRALEHGDLDVAAAMDRLAALDDRDDSPSLLATSDE
jgi:hypothetical protein